jgi:hypothetical protein
VLLSQERVLTLLYDKTFPPKQQQLPFNNKGSIEGLESQYDLKMPYNEDDIQVL